MTVKIITGDCREVLKTLPDESVHCVVTSPPYFGLRDYGAEGQIGLELTSAEYLGELVRMFREVRRVLRSDGTAWVNMGDSYAGSWGAQSRKHAGKHAPNVSALSANQVKAAQKRTNTGTIREPGIKPKDLMGVPWRLAFALQEPWERAHIKDRADRAWLAALVDGEGCLTIMQAQNGEKSATSFPPVMQVKMTDPECIEYANAITGFEQCLRQDPPSLGGNRQTFQWRITSRRASDIVAEIYPFLRIKRKQAVVLWNHQLVRDSYETKRGSPMPAEAREKQIQCRALIQSLNRREPVDIPSWMVEPRVAVEPGWYLRQDVIWSKPNPMPESVTDRCTKAHEYLFLLAKSERYWFDADAIKEDCVQDESRPTFRGVAYVNNSTFDNADGGKSTDTGNVRRSWKGSQFHIGKTGQHQLGRSQKVRKPAGWDTGAGGHGSIHRHGRAQEIEYQEVDGSMRNKRSVWTVATQPFSEAHFATFPPALIEPCILAGCPEGGTVLDPFGGAGTTGLVADRLQRNAILIELNPEYAAMAERRIRGDAPLFAEVAA